MNDIRTMFAFHSDSSAFCNGFKSLESRIQNIELTGNDYLIDDSINIPKELVNKWKGVCCDLAQLIQGWNATESEWSEWDKQAYEKLVEMQKELNSFK